MHTCKEGRQRPAQTDLGILDYCGGEAGSAGRGQLVRTLFLSGKSVWASPPVFVAFVGKERLGIVGPGHRLFNVGRRSLGRSL